jgi:hypothetical protein
VHAYSTSPDAISAAAELRTARDEAVVVDRQVAAQGVEGNATGAALKVAEARSLALFGKRDVLARLAGAVRVLARDLRAR